jgi:hypothetical protein
MRCTLALVCVAIGVHDVDGQFFRTSCATWTAARAQCIAEGGDLVVIPDEDKNTVVTEFMQTFDDYGTCAGCADYFRVRVLSVCCFMTRIHMLSD